MTSTIGRTKTHHINVNTFRHPQLSQTELDKGTRLGLDSWADTSCAGRHAYVEAFVEGRVINATGFSSSLGQLKDLPIAHVLYAYDHSDGQVYLLENFNAIYMGENMNDSLLNPIQCEDNGVHVDLRPKRYHYGSALKCQSLEMQDGFLIPILYDGVLPFVPVRRPTPEEIDRCTRLQLTAEHDWDPFSFNGFFASVLHDAIDDDFMPFSTDPISSSLMGEHLGHHFADQTLLHRFNDEHLSLRAINSTSKSTITPESLSQLWNIGLKTATRTLQATTHKAIRTTGLLSRRLRTDKMQLRYKQMSRQFGRFYSDYFKFPVKSLRGYIGGTIYTNKLGFISFFPCADEKGETVARTFKSFIEIVGLPHSLHTDNHKNYKEGPFRRLIRKLSLRHTFTEPHSPWQNRAEHSIGELKRYARRLMESTNTPIRLWCFCFEYCATIMCLCATGRYDLRGRTSYEAVMQFTPDISEYVSYRWYQWCWYYDDSIKSKRLCRWLGPANGIGQSFCSYILLNTADFIARSSVIPIPDSELTSDNMKERCQNFTDSVADKIGNHRQPFYDTSDPAGIYRQLLSPLPTIPHDEEELPYGDEIVDAIPEDIDQAYLDSLDTYIGVQVVIPGITHDSQPVLATVRGRKRDSQGNPIGRANPNPILDTRIYQLEFPDGRVEEYGLNIIAEYLHSQVDENGWDTGIFDEIIEVRSDETAIVPGEHSTIMVNGRSKPVITTKGWQVLVKWTDKSTSWVPLSHIKESNPVQMAEFAVAHNIHNQPAFKWWVSHVLRKRDAIVSKVKTRAQRKGNMKFGVLVPTTVKEALQQDEIQGNTLWRDAIEKEMKNSRIAFELLERGVQPPPGHKKITCHMNFEVKIDLRRKARYVAGGHLTDPPTSMTYSTVVSRESVRIAFLIAALNGLDILAADIQNAYLNAPTEEKLYFIAGPEWKSDQGRTVVIVRALYGLKSSALAFRNHLADVLSNQLGYKSSLADPDLWYKPSVKTNGEKYYSYILVYVDDLLCIDTNPMSHMLKLQESYTVRKETIKEPDKYLGADISKVNFNDGSYAFTMGSGSYTKAAIKNVKDRMKEDDFRFHPKLSDPQYSAKQPFSTLSYRPELDTSAECNDKQVQFYQNLIGVLRWLVELGRIDIGFECALLSKYLAMPRTGHLLQALHVFKYLDIHWDNELTFDPQEYEINEEQKVESEQKHLSMKSLYVDAEEEIPPNAPEPRGRAVQINCFVDSDHAGDTTTRRSHTGIIIYVNKAPITWYSKQQTTVESSTFGSEFVALRLATEQVISIRYKIRMFGIPIKGATNIFCDNEAVFKNASIAESRLKKKHNSVCFHRVRESVASGISNIFKVDTLYNLADILTKSLSPTKRLAIRKMIMPQHQ